MKYVLPNAIYLSDSILFPTLVGRLVYPFITGSNITYAMHVVSHFIIFLTIVHWTFVFHLLCYLSKTQFQSLLILSSSSLELHSYYDAHWIGDLIDHKSTLRGLSHLLKE